MSSSAIAVVILAAGLGTRMRSRLPKVLHPLAGRPMLSHLADSLAALRPDRVVVVTAPGMDEVAAAASPAVATGAPLAAVQHPALGTAHAASAALPQLAGFEGDVLVVYGDAPLVRSETLQAMLRARRAGPAVVVLGFRPADPAAYGRLVRDGEGALVRIVEAMDASPAELAIGLCNAGAMAVEAAALRQLLAEVGNDNAKGEYYLTDLVALAHGRELTCGIVEAAPDEVLGINCRSELAAAEAVLQHRLRRAAMDGGATLLDPASVHFSWDTRLAPDVMIEPSVFFGPGVSVGEGAVIRGFCHLEGVEIAPGAQVGPFARVRPASRIGPGAHIGNFVEVKNSTLEAGAKANHLSYLGDAEIGARANIGAGTITCNYDGAGKYRTAIGAGAFIGSNTALVAPVSVGEAAIVGAGSTIVRDVPDGAVAVARAEQQERAGAAERTRERARARKAAAGSSQPAGPEGAPAPGSRRA